MRRAYPLIILLVASVGCGGCDNASNARADADDGDRGDTATPDVGDSGSRPDATITDLGDPGTPGEPWIDVTSSGRSPTQQRHPRMAFDVARAQPVLVSGGETWVWTGEIWEMVAPAPPPAERERFALAYDASRENVVLFGGGTNLETFDDTWLWDGTSWTEQSPQTAPPAVFGHVMTYDEAREQVVLYGGGAGAGLPSNEDTWVWNGSTWEMLASAVGTGPTSANAISYDAARGVSVLYGNASLWEFDGTAWQLVDDGTTISPPRSEPAMVYDPVREQVLFFGGQNSGTFFTDTWTWDGTSWTDITSEVGALPRGRTRHAAVFDSTSGGAMFFGGFGDTGDILTQLFDETWVVRDGKWTEVSPGASPRARDGAAMAYDSAREVVFLYGGVASGGGRYDADSWTWNGRFWRRVVHDSLPGQRYRASMAFDAVRQEVVLFGGGDSETFTWDGSDWHLESPIDSPPSVTSQLTLMVWDAARQQILLYALGGTWTWDGDNWTLVSDANPAESFGVTALAYDAAREAPVLIGSRFPQNGAARVSSAWTWDGAAWTEIATEGTPPEPRGFAAAFWDTRRDAVVLFGGTDERSNLLADTWELHGNAWQNLTPPVSPQGRQRHAIAFDAARSRGVVFGGASTTGSTWEWVGSAAVAVE